MTLFPPRYDPRENSWFSVAGMSTQRAGVDVTVLGNSLYAVGGKASHQCLSLLQQEQVSPFDLHHIIIQEGKTNKMKAFNQSVF